MFIFPLRFGDVRNYRNTLFAVNERLFNDGFVYLRTKITRTRSATLLSTWEFFVTKM